MLCGSLTCNLKLRVYQVASNNFVIEAQRRAGDAVVFAEVFGKLDRYLRERSCLIVKGRGHQHQSPPAACARTGQCAASSSSTIALAFESIAGMVGAAPKLGAQMSAEWASMLLQTVVESQAGLNFEEAGAAFSTLLRSSDEDAVLLPTAEALRLLARSLGARRLLEDRCLAEAMHEKLRRAPAAADCAWHHKLNEVLQAFPAVGRRGQTTT